MVSAAQFKAQWLDFSPGKIPTVFCFPNNENLTEAHYNLVPTCCNKPEKGNYSFQYILKVTITSLNGFKLLIENNIAYVIKNSNHC